MQLFLMRHGDAGFNAQSDRDRTLTDVGRHHTVLMSNWLARSVSDFDLVLVSPYLRAQQTWQTLSQHFPEPRKWLVADDLVPSGDPANVAALILAYAELYFTNTLWPDFTPAEFDTALAEFGNIYTRIQNPTQDVAEQRIAIAGVLRLGDELVDVLHGVAGAAELAGDLLHGAGFAHQTDALADELLLLDGLERRDALDRFGHQTRRRGFQPFAQQRRPGPGRPAALISPCA